MDFHPVVLLVTLVGLVHLRIALPLFFFGGAEHRDQGGIDDRALPHHQAPCADEGVDGLKDLAAQLVLLEEVADGQNRSLIRDQVTDQIDAGKTSHGGHLNQGLLHRRVAERVPLLQEMDPQHGGQRIGMSAAFLVRFGAVGGSISLISACQGTTTSISERNFSRLVCFSCLRPR